MRLSYLFSPGIVTAVLAMGGGSFATGEGKYNGEFVRKTLIALFRSVIARLLFWNFFFLIM